MIKFESEAMKQGALKTIRVDNGEWPDLLPQGSRCQIMGVNPSQLAMGDVVATADGKFRRFWSSDGKNMWLTDRSGLQHEASVVKDALVRKVLVSPGVLRNLVWMLGASAGRMRRRS
ncbi:hypothetical protein IV102_07435 [bacterium]|nr:hypothetical protein [bacterium]